MPSGSILLEYTKICSPRWRTRCDFRKIYLHCHLLYYLISISNFKNGFLEVLDINSLLITAFLLELWFPSVITGFPLFTLSPSFYFFNGFPCIFFYFSASSYCFWITLILLGWISNIPSPGSYFFFHFWFPIHYKIPAKFKTHFAFLQGLLFSSPIFLCSYSSHRSSSAIQTWWHHDCIFSAFLLQPYLSCLHSFWR